MQADSKFFQLTKALKTPFLMIDLACVEKNYRDMASALPGVQVRYSVKCNDAPRVTSCLRDLGCGFEIASLVEAEPLVQQGVPPHKIICMHPIKSPEFLRYMRRHQLDVMAVDGYEEVDKIAYYAPNGKLVVRVSVNNEGSGWHLDGKFGIIPAEALTLLEHIRASGLQPHGLMFHVGSQCENIENWVQALAVCREIWQSAREVGIEMKFLSLGGGFPAQYRRPVLAWSAIGERISAELKHGFEGESIEVVMEPGRALLANAGILVTTVFGLAQREATRWAYIETGTYNGLVEAIETPDRQFYPLVVEDTRRARQHYHIGGPSCVALDAPFEDVELPELCVGDRLYILGAGAYTVTCAVPFNGFPIPSVHYYQDLVS
jgi:ornithine decarboxylase